MSVGSRSSACAHSRIMTIATHRSVHHRVPGAVLGSLALLALAACQSGELPLQDLGNTSDQLSTEEPPANPADFFEGRWVGEAQDIFSVTAEGIVPPYAFPSGSTRIALDVSYDDYGVHANITFGAAPLPAPEVGVAYPPGFDAYYSGFIASLYVPPFEGFEYPLAESNGLIFDPNFLVLELDRHAPYVEWCALQPALDQGDGDFDCLGAAGLAGGAPPDEPCIKFNADDSQEPVDCNLAALCVPSVGAVCSCDHDDCEATEARDAHLTLRRSGDQLLGSLDKTFPSSAQGVFLPLGLIRFQRVAD